MLQAGLSGINGLLVQTLVADHGDGFKSARAAIVSLAHVVKKKLVQAIATHAKKQIATTMQHAPITTVQQSANATPDLTGMASIVGL